MTGRLEAVSFVSVIIICRAAILNSYLKIYHLKIQVYNTNINILDENQHKPDTF